MTRKTRVREHSRTNAPHVKEHERVLGADPREQHVVRRPPLDLFSGHVVIDLESFTEADDGNTSHYGGSAWIIDPENDMSSQFRGHGTDRGDSTYDEIVEYLVERFDVSEEKAMAYVTLLEPGHKHTVTRKDIEGVW
jgi:hypothetical protein